MHDHDQLKAASGQLDSKVFSYQENQDSQRAADTERAFLSQGKSDVGFDLK